ncbi:hypothetical protein JOC77_001845 [Peribacillus deserti]|uniref:Uncharacterized protein n=1 Tax=Peribacillus deserti TaxID=673318 RepID=A0ABS2QHA9_9BACI|nr:hypothetical protein [Peribacillus deserti]MBM7692415.1 hypothetical protein [Peribacillus deserti]
MNSLQDAIYNWLTIKIVCDARPDDTAAQDTKQMFEELLVEDHKLSYFQAVKQEPMYVVEYTQAGETKTARFPVELVEVMLQQINEEPHRYRNFT